MLLPRKFVHLFVANRTDFGYDEIDMYVHTSASFFPFFRLDIFRGIGTDFG